MPNYKGIWVPGGLPADASITFETLQIDLSEPLFLRPMSEYGIPVLPSGDASETPASARIERPFSGLNRSGSISRSISFGNGQDAVLNSNFNLQLSGKISEKTSVRASIADNSLPVQTDGFSQQLREFDQIFIEIENEDFGRVRAGDVQIERNGSLFLNFTKRVTGGLVETSFPVGEGNMHAIASGALARGRFHRNTFLGQEGNQGPYRLTGARSERFILIISGSERVYLDGVLMKRGADKDYLINYSTGEITFTALRPITREKRINVEFQYTDQSFLRSVVYGGLDFQQDQWTFSSYAYSEQDNPDQPLQLELSDQEKQLLADSGDQWEDIRISTIRPASGLEGEIAYRIVDTLGFDSVLVYAPLDTVNTFVAGFQEVGQGQGDYVLDQVLATGSVYRWVPPVNGIRQGRYAPVRGLPAPNQLQVISNRAAYSSEKLGQIGVEWAVSRNDENRFSSIDKENDIGQALRLNWSKQAEEWSFGTDYQFNQGDFRTVERIRNVEFARDWNLNGRETEDLHLAEARLTKMTEEGGISAKVAAAAAGEDYRGLRPELEANWNSEKWDLRLKSSYLFSADSNSRSDFFREDFLLARSIGRQRIGIQSQGEWNTARGEQNALLRPYSFFDNEVFHEWGDSTDVYFNRLGLFFRTDDSADVNAQDLRRAATARGIRWSSLFQPGANSRLGAYVQFRELTLTDAEASDRDRQSITSRLQYRQFFWRKSIQSTSFYESGISSEPLRSFSYIRVLDGTGLYTWVDYNDNGVQELNEFELAQLPGQGNYVRVFVPGRNFQQAGRTLLTQYLGFTPRLLLKNNAARPFWSRWAVQWNYSLENLNILDGTSNPLDPFYDPANDSLKVALRKSNRVTLFFNRTQLAFGGDYSFLDQRNEQLQTYGPERSEIQTHRLTLRFQLAEQFNLSPVAEIGFKELSTPGFLQRNYRLDLQEFRLQMSWQISMSTNLSTVSSWKRSVNMLESGEQLEAFSQRLNAQYSLGGKSNLNAGVDIRANDFTGSAFSPVGFEMLQGLLPGNNYLWNVYWEKQFFDFLQFNLRYDGRSSPGTEVIHTASMQVKALF